MKTTFVAVFIAFLFIACHAQTNEKPVVTENKNADTIEVYYFHYTHRCITCNTVEEVSKQALKEYYGDKLVLVSVNLDEKESEAKAKQLKIEGQTLLIVKGDKTFDLTNDAFMNARSKPDKLKALIKSTIDPLL